MSNRLTIKTEEIKVKTKEISSRGINLLLVEIPQGFNCTIVPDAKKKLTYIYFLEAGDYPITDRVPASGPILVYTVNCVLMYSRQIEAMVIEDPGFKYEVFQIINIL